MPQKVDFSSVFLGQDWWEAKIRPKQILNQKFATVLSDEDLSNADVHEHKGFKIRPRMPASMKASGLSEVKIDKDGFRVSLDLDEFELEELSVKTFDRFVEVHGKQKEKRDKHGLVSREFRRRYMVPSNCDIKALAASFSNDKLTIETPTSRKEQKMFNLAMEVPVVEKELNPLEIKLVQEELFEIVQKMARETILKGKPGDDLTERNSLSENDLKALKIVENEVYETVKKFRVADESAKHPDELSTIEAGHAVQQQMYKMGFSKNLQKYIG